MAFEFFFGVFGLISSDSKSHHKFRLDGDWRLFTPLGASLFKDPASGGPGAGIGTRDSSGNKSPSTSSAGLPASFKSSADLRQHKPIFNITGTLTNANYSGK